MLMLMRYWARATDSLFPVILMVLSRLAGASLSSQLEIRIMAPESCLISATLEPPLPMMQPMSSLGTVISWVCWVFGDRAWPDNIARAAGLIRLVPRGFPFIVLICRPFIPICCCCCPACPAVVTCCCCTAAVLGLCGTTACEGWKNAGRL